MTDGAVTNPSIDRAEHIDEGGLSAKRVGLYFWDGSAWQRQGSNEVNYDNIAFSNADGNGNYQTVVYKLNGTTVRTLTLTYDANSNVTSIVRT